MISIQQFRSSVGRFEASRHREAKVYKSENKVRKETRTAIKIVIFYLLTMAAVMSGLNLEVHQSPVKMIIKYQVFKTKEVSSPEKFQVTSKSLNKMAHITNGNRRDNGHPISLCYWNKGSANLENRKESIAEIIQDHKPHVLGIGEAQYRRNSDISKVQQPEYQLHLGPCLDSMGVCRVAVYTHNSLVVQRRRDLEDPREPILCLQLGLPRQKKILVLCGYRQWKIPGAGQDSGSIAAQVTRWDRMLIVWENAIEEDKETIMMMDANLNSNSWTMLDKLPNNHYDV